MSSNTQGFLGSNIATKDLEVRLIDLRERSMMDPLLHGDQGLHFTDRLTILELFAEGDSQRSYYPA